MAYGTPFLLQLGLSKSLMSLVWLAGPLSGKGGRRYLDPFMRMIECSLSSLSKQLIYAFRFLSHWTRRVGDAASCRRTLRPMHIKVGSAAAFSHGRGRCSSNIVPLSWLV